MRASLHPKKVGRGRGREEGIEKSREYGREEGRKEESREEGRKQTHLRENLGKHKLTLPGNVQLIKRRSPCARRSNAGLF